MVVRLAGVLKVSADVLLGIVPLERADEFTRAREFWKAFQLAAHLPQRDKRAVALLISSLAAGHASR